MAQVRQAKRTATVVLCTPFEQVLAMAKDAGMIVPVPVADCPVRSSYIDTLVRKYRKDDE